MKRVKILLMLAFAGLSTVAWGQDGTIDKGSGWLYFSGVPGTTPNVSCCAEIAMNILTREAYVWNRDSSEWELLIEITQGLAAPSGDPGDGPKLFLNRDDGLLYRWDGDSWEAYGSGGAVADGDKGDITVSSSGTVWNIDAGVVGASEIASTAVTPASYTLASITVDADGRITAASNGTEVDGSITNEGSLTVGAGTGSTSLINSNTSGSTAVTLEAGSNITISEAGNTITIAAAASATDSSIYKLLPLRSVTIDPNNFDLQIGTDALNNTGEFEFYALNAEGNDVGVYAGSEDSSGISGLFPAAAALFSDDGNVLIDYNYVGDIYNVAMFGDSMFMGAYPGADLGLHIDDLPRDPQDTLSLLLVQDWVTRRVYRRAASTIGGQTLFKVENSATDATVGTTNNYHVGKLGIGNFASDVLGASLHIYNTDATITLSDSTSTDSTATPQLKFFRGHNASLLGRMGYFSTTNTDLYFTNNATAGKLTFQTEGATVGQLLPSGQLLLPEYGDTTFTGTAVKYLAVTDAGNVIEADGGGSSAPSVSSPTVASTTAIDFNSLDRGIFDLDMSGVATTSLLLSNPRNGGEYTFWFDNASNEVVDFPANFLTAGRDTLGARDLAASRLLRFFYDGTNYICEDTIGSASVTYLDTVLLSGIVAWYNANDIGQADGTPVATWNDVSGNGNHLVQDTTGRQPNYETNFVSGEAVVDFDGVDEWMRTLTGSLVLDTINRTFFIVCKSDDATTSSGIFIFNDGSEETAGTAGQFGLTNEIAARIDGGNRVWTADLVTGDGWDQITVMLGTSSTNGTSTSDVSGWLNGSAMSVSSTSALTLDTDDTFFSVGRKTADFNQVFSFFDGQIAEIIAYNRALTTAERQNIETYLTNKYGAF